jgi:hypothetical protein
MFLFVGLIQGSRQISIHEEVFCLIRLNPNYFKAQVLAMHLFPNFVSIIPRGILYNVILYPISWGMQHREQ